MYDLTRKDIRVSDSVHRALNYQVEILTNQEISGWKDNYRILLRPDGKFAGRPTKQNQSNSEISGELKEEIINLPTPSWVTSEQKCYLCFWYEVKKLMGEWWEEYAESMRFRKPGT